MPLSTGVGFNRLVPCSSPWSLRSKVIVRGPAPVYRLPGAFARTPVRRSANLTALLSLIEAGLYWNVTMSGGITSTFARKPRCTSFSGIALLLRPSADLPAAEPLLVLQDAYLLQQSARFLVRDAAGDRRPPRGRRGGPRGRRRLGGFARRDTADLLFDL